MQTISQLELNKKGRDFANRKENAPKWKSERDENWFGSERPGEWASGVERERKRKREHNLVSVDEASFQSWTKSKREEWWANKRRENKMEKPLPRPPLAMPDSHCGRSLMFYLRTQVFTTALPSCLRVSSSHGPLRKYSETCQQSDNKCIQRERLFSVACVCGIPLDPGWTMQLSIHP